MMQNRLLYLFKNYFEAGAFSLGLILLAFMDPEAANGPSLCFFEWVGITFCPGEGLGHSISYMFRGDFNKALESNFLGLFSIVVIGGRIIFLIKQKMNNRKNK